MMNSLHAEHRNISISYILPHGTIKQPQIQCLYLNDGMTIVMIGKSLISLSTYVQWGPQILIIQNLKEEQRLLHPCSISLKGFGIFGLFSVRYVAVCKTTVLYDAEDHRKILFV